jgi:Putative Actinobacterial Holin-X, holin superfamily III
MPLDLKTDSKNDQTESVTSLVSGIVHDAQELFEQQFELFKHEVRADIRKIKVGMQVLSLGAGIIFVGCILLGLALVQVLQMLAPQLPLWACYAICGAAVVAVGGGLYLAGWAKLNTINALPEQTAEALKENLQWTTKQKPS